MVETRKKVVLFVHGIRTLAERDTSLKYLLKQHTSYECYSVRYWPFDAVDMFLPQVFYGHVRKLVLTAMVRYQDGVDLTIIAHSFGTYVVTRILDEYPTLKLERLILCGSVVSTDYDWSKLQLQVSGEIISDCGTKDIFPPLAELLSSRYSATGVRGCGTPVFDRYFPIGHSGFFDTSFMEEWWLPLFKLGPVDPGILDGPGSRHYPWYIRFIMWLASCKKNIAVAIIISVIVYLLLVLFNGYCPLGCDRSITNFRRHVSYESSACNPETNDRQYSNFIRDEISFNAFIPSYEARWSFTKDLTTKLPKDTPPTVSDLGASGKPVTFVDHSNETPPYYGFPISVSWLRRAQLYWDYRDFRGVPEGVGIKSRYPIKKFTIEVDPPYGSDLQACEKCDTFHKGLSIEGVERHVIEDKNKCSFKERGHHISCNIDIPAERLIQYKFKIENWECRKTK